MRAKQFINEIERLSAMGPVNTIYVPSSVNRENLVKNSKKLPGNNPYRYNIVQTNGQTDIYMIDSGEVAQNEVIGKLTIEPIHFPLKNAGYVDMIAVHKNYTGYGIAKSMYGIWLSILKRPLVAGSMQTPGGRRNWVSLNKIPGVQVKGYIKINDWNLKQQEDADWQIVADAIMNTGAQYIGKDFSDGHYFGVDIESNKDLTELQAVYKKVVNIYSDEDEWSKVETGLYAVWGGK